MPTIEINQAIEMYRKVQGEWWLTPHVTYTMTDDYDNVISGGVTVRKSLAPIGVHSDWLPEDVNEWPQRLNGCFSSIRVPQSVMDQYYWKQAVDDIVSELVFTYWCNGPDAVFSRAY